MSLTACVLHTGYIHPNGYGRVRVNGRRGDAHRMAWEAVHGPVPSEMHLHHVCENKACINVDHLLPVTHEQHMALHAVTHCVNGHPFDAANTYVRADGRRQCRACKRAAQARYQKGKGHIDRARALGVPVEVHGREASDG